MIELLKVIGRALIETYGEEKGMVIFDRLIGELKNV